MQIFKEMYISAFEILLKTLHTKGKGQTMSNFIQSIQDITEDMNTYAKRYLKQSTTPKEYGMALKNKRGKRGKTVKGREENRNG